MDENERNEIQELVNKELFKFSNIEDEKHQPKSKELVNQIHDAAVLSAVKNDEVIQKKFTDQATKSIHTELGTIDKEIKTRNQIATYDANVEACKNYGIDKHVPTWQITLMKFGSGFWFIIYWLFASLTIAPLSIFFKGISAFVKTSWIVFVLAFIAYLIIVIGIPLLINYFG